VVPEDGYVAENKVQTTLTLCSMLLAAAHFPEEQDKVQAELDAVIGRHKGNLIPYCSSVKFNGLCTQAPTFADQQSLTRLRAFISEASRWRPIAPNGEYRPRGWCPQFLTTILQEFLTEQLET